MGLESLAKRSRDAQRWDQWAAEYRAMRTRQDGPPRCVWDFSFTENERDEIEGICATLRYLAVGRTTKSLRPSVGRQTVTVSSGKLPEIFRVPIKVRQLARYARSNGQRIGLDAASN